MVTLFATDLPLQPGALELVDALRGEGVPLALVSSSYRVLVDAALQVIGPERFDFTLAGDEVAPRLKDAGVTFAARNGRTRLGFHLYNTQADVELVLNALKGAELVTI